MSSDKDTHAQVVTADDFCEPGVLCVVQADAAEVFWDLETKGAQFSHSLERSQYLMSAFICNFFE